MNLLSRLLLGVALSSVVTPVLSAAAPAAEARPNIIFILADDLGYGDVGCYGATKVRTPHVDRLAREGLRFTDAHTTASVCTPTRFAFMTGEYAWRRPDTGIAPGNARSLIARSTPTVASVLRSAGYATGIVGKWHLGLGETTPDFNRDIDLGPNDLGFDYSFIIPATGDRVPCVFVENRRVVGLDPAHPITVSFGTPIPGVPTGLSHPEQLIIKADRGHSQSIVRGISRIGYMKGGDQARWRDEEIADTLARKAVAFIERQDRRKPFFLFLSTHDIHEPMVPHPRFRGTSECGWRGDVIHQFDWTVGEILAALDRRGIARDTLVVLTSDNGGAIKDTYDDGTNALHERQPPNGVLRGRKGQLYEGGHRVPFLVRWPARVAAGKTSDALLALVDMLPTFAALAGGKVPAKAAPDGVNVMPALIGTAGDKGRSQLVLQGNRQAPLALRQGSWVLIETAGGKTELYDLAADLKQERDRAAAEPARVEEMARRLASERAKSGAAANAAPAGKKKNKKA